MANGKAEQAGTKVITISDLNVAIGELVTQGVVAKNITELIEKGFVSAEVAEVKVESGKFTGDYVKLGIGDNAKTEKQVIAALVAISGGNLTPPAAEQTDGETDETDDRKPSLVKFALYGSDLNARARTSQRIKAAAEGPDRAIERMAKNLMAAKPGKFTLEQAREQARIFLED